MNPTLLAWIESAIVAVAVAVSTVVVYLYKRSEKLSDQTIQGLRDQVLEKERARAKAEQGEADAKEAYAKLKGEWKATVKALQAARVWVDPGASVGLVRDLDENRDPTGVFHVEGHHARTYFRGALTEREEYERRRQRSLNPSADRDLDARLARYNRDSSDPPSK